MIKVKWLHLRVRVSLVGARVSFVHRLDPDPLTESVGLRFRVRHNTGRSDVSPKTRRVAGKGRQSGTCVVSGLGMSAGLDGVVGTLQSDSTVRVNDCSHVQSPLPPEVHPWYRRVRVSSP